MKYLSLALFAQRMVDALIDFVEDNNRVRLDEYAAPAIASLRGMLGTGDRAQRIRALRHYEQVRTVTETVPDRDQLRAVIEAFETLVAPDVSRKQQVRNAKDLIEFFHKLEKQALLNCNRPDKPLPRGLHQLLHAR